MSVPVCAGEECDDRQGNRWGQDAGRARRDGQPVGQIERDSDRDRWFTAAGAVGYGLIDSVITDARSLPEGRLPGSS